MSPHEIIIRKETPADYFETEAMTRRAFWNKFGPGCNEHLLVHLERKSPALLPELCRVAEVDGHIAGVIMYFKAKIITPEGAEITVPSFGPLCADHALKNSGIGTALLDATLPMVKAAGYPGVIIFGEPDYYPKHGFVRAGSLGLTDMEGNARDAFMAWESEPGSLRIPGGRFSEGEIEEGLTDENLEKLEQEQPYEYLARVNRPCQWSYDNAADEKNGYHMMYAVQSPRAFDSLFRSYLAELSQYRESLKRLDPDKVNSMFRWDVNAARYLIMIGNEPAGLFVTTAPKTAAWEKKYGSDLTEIYIRPEYRQRGIAADLFTRFLRQQKTSTTFHVIKNNPARDVWLHLLEKEGYEYTLTEEEDGMLLYRVAAEKKEKGGEG